jgi:hypothetical protein
MTHPLDARVNAQWPANRCPMCDARRIAKETQSGGISFLYGVMFGRAHPPSTAGNVVELAKLCCEEHREFFVECCAGLLVELEKISGKTSS